MLRLSNIRIGTKLAIISGIAIVLVIGMAANQQLSVGSVAAMTAKAQRAVSVRKSVLSAQIAILRTWVARRNILLAETVDEADTAINLMRVNTATANQNIDRATELSVVLEDR